MGGPDHQTVEREDCGARSLMKVDLSTAAMVRREMKDVLHAGDGRLGGSGRQQVRLQKFHGLSVEQVLHVRPGTAREVVGDPYRRPASDQRIHEVGADERTAAGDQGAPAFPVRQDVSSPRCA